MHSIFQYYDYKEFVRDRVALKPRGEYLRMAEHLGVNKTMLSQVFGGYKHLNLELASELADYLKLRELEQEYFFLMILYAKAGSEKLREKLSRRLQRFHGGGAQGVSGDSRGEDDQVVETCSAV